MPKNITRIAPVHLAGIKRSGRSRRGRGGRRRDDRSNRRRDDLHGGSSGTSRGKLEGVPAGNTAASSGSRLSSLGSLSSASLRLSGAGGTDRLHLGRSEARNILIHVQGTAHGSAAVPGSSISVAEESSGLWQGGPDGGQKDDQAVGGRRLIRRRGENSILKAKLMVKQICGHGGQTVSCRIRPQESEDQAALPLALNTAILRGRCLKR